MALTGKQFYECPAETVVVAGDVTYRPLLASAVDSNGGVWAVCEQFPDAATGQAPISFTVAVNDRRDPTQPRNPAVHAAVAQQVAAAVSLGPNIVAARAALAHRWAGQGRETRMNDQVVGGE